MKRITTITITAALLVAGELSAIVVGCRRSSDKVVYKPLVFKEEQEVHFTPITDEQLWGGTASIYKVRDYLVVAIYQEDSVPSFLHVFDTSGLKIADHVKFGRGPKEIMTKHSVQKIGSGIHIFDMMQKKEIEVELNEDGRTAAISEAPVSGKVGLIQSYRLGDGFLRYYVVSPKEDQAEHPRITIESQAGDTLDAFHSSPFDYENPWVRSQMDGLRFNMAVSPDMSHFAITYNDASVIELFKLGKSIKEIYRGYFYPPKFKVEGTNVVPEDGLIWAFNALYASNSHVFASYDGDLDSANKSIRSNKIAIFDWEGHALKLLKTDYRVEAMCYSEDDSIIYAVIIDGSGRNFLGKLNINLK
jgi:hypothetical protein